MGQNSRQPQINSIFLIGILLFSLFNAFTHHATETVIDVLDEDKDINFVNSQTYWGSPSVIASTNNVGEFGKGIASDSNGFIHISYWDKISKDLLYITNTTGSWVSTNIHSSGNIGKYSDIVVDSNDHIHIVYFDDSNDDLRYATNSSGSWTNSLIDGSSSSVGTEISLTINANDLIVASYYDSTSADLKVASYQSANGWQTKTVDSSGSVGKQSSITINNNTVHIAYCDESNSNLKYATIANINNIANSNSWTISTVDNTNDFPCYTTSYSSIVVDSYNELHIAYFAGFAGQLWYQTTVNGTSSQPWTKSVIDSGSVGQFTRMAIDSNDNLHIAYHDASNKDLKYVTNYGGSWNISVLDSPGYVGRFVAITVDNNDDVHIAYHDSDTGQDLKYVRTHTPSSGGGGSGGPVNTGCGYDHNLTQLNVSHPSYLQEGDTLTVNLTSTCNLLNQTMYLTYAMSGSSQPSGLFQWTAYNLNETHQFNWTNVTPGNWPIYANLNYYDASGTMVGLDSSATTVIVNTTLIPQIDDLSFHGGAYPQFTANLSQLDTGITYKMSWNFNNNSSFGDIYFSNANSLSYTWANFSFPYGWNDFIIELWEDDNVNATWVLVDSKTISTYIPIPASIGIDTVVNQYNVGDVVEVEIETYDLELYEQYTVYWDLNNGSQVGNFTWTAYNTFNDEFLNFTGLPAGNHCISATLLENGTQVDFDYTCFNVVSIPASIGIDTVVNQYNVGDVVEVEIETYDLELYEQYTVYWDLNNGSQVGNFTWTAYNTFNDEFLNFTGLPAGNHCISATLLENGTQVDFDYTCFNVITVNNNPELIVALAHSYVVDGGTAWIEIDATDLNLNESYLIEWWFNGSTTDSGNLSWISSSNSYWNDLPFHNLGDGEYCFEAQLIQAGNVVDISSDCFEVVIPIDVILEGHTIVNNIPHYSDADQVEIYLEVNMEDTSWQAFTWNISSYDAENDTWNLVHYEWKYSNGEYNGTQNWSPNTGCWKIDAYIWEDDGINAAFVVLIDNSLDNIFTVGDSNSCSEEVELVFSYPLDYYVFTENEYVEAIYPEVNSVDEISYHINPNLPNGLVFDSVTGSISGTPVQVMEKTQFTITGVDPLNSSWTETIEIEVLSQPLPISIDFNDYVSLFNGIPHYSTTSDVNISIEINMDESRWQGAVWILSSYDRQNDSWNEEYQVWKWSNGIYSFPEDSSLWSGCWNMDLYIMEDDGENAAYVVEIETSLGHTFTIGDALSCMPELDSDQDGDGFADDVDTFPNNPTQWNDTDGDGYGDNQDGLEGDECPETYGLSYIDRFGCVDSDSDGYSDICENDFECIGPFAPSNLDELKLVLSACLEENSTGNCANHAEQYGAIGDWEVSQITNMNGLFSGASEFNQDISNWDVSNVQNMDNMFFAAFMFNQDIGGWDVSNVTTMDAMFHDADDFDQFIGEWDVSNVENMRKMFRYASSFNQDLSEWNVGKVTHMGDMFYDTAFNQDISNWNVSNVQDMSYMFFESRNFNQDLSIWQINTSANLDNMFDPQIQMSEEWKCSIYTAFNSVPSWNMDWSESCTTTFKPVTKSELQTAVDLWTEDREVAMEVYGNISEWDVSEIMDMSNLFYGKTSFNDDISRWDVSNVMNMKEMFRNAKTFNQDLSEWDVSNVIDMSGMFASSDGQNGNSGFDGDIKDWDVSNVINMHEMFRYATDFNQDISSWDVSNVENMNHMFDQARSFNQDISNWDVSFVNDMGNMFMNAVMFDQDLSEWDVSNAQTGQMFDNAPLSDENKCAIHSEFSEKSSSWSYDWEETCPEDDTVGSGLEGLPGFQAYFALISLLGAAVIISRKTENVSLRLTTGILMPLATIFDFDKAQ